jgi:F-type H+-transporting ATPase subunit b
MTGLVQFSAIPIGLGLIVIGAALGIGKFAAAAAESIARQPSAADKITGAINLPLLFIWTILTFLGLLFALKRLAWGPLLEALETRQNAIRKSLDDAQQAKSELERLNAESARIIQQARVDAEGIVSQGRVDGERLREEIRTKARTEADNIVKNAERQIQLETSRALEQIRREAVDLSVMIASKIIQRNLTKEDNERLIDEALKQVQGRAN